MNLELNEYLDKIKNDLYFSECVADYVKNKSIEGMMNICKILEYRSFFIGIYFNIMDKKILKQFEKEKHLDFSIFEDNNICEKEVLKVKSLTDDNKDILCIFTDPSKIDFEKMSINTLAHIDLKYVYDNYFNDENICGLLINFMNEEIYIDRLLIELIMAKQYENLETLVEILFNPHLLDELEF